MLSGKLASKVLFGVLFVVIFARAANSQLSLTPTISFSPSDMERHSVGFSIGIAGLKPADISNATNLLEQSNNWYISYRGSRLAVSNLHFNPAVLTVDMDCGCSGVPSYRDLKSGEMTFIYMPPGESPSLSSFTPATKAKALSFVKDAKSADISISGSVQSAVSAKPVYQWSVNAKYPFTLLRRYGNITPSFIGQATQPTSSNPDSSKATAAYEKAFSFQNTRQGVIVDADLIGYEFELTPKQEAVIIGGAAKLKSYQQKNTNLTWADSLHYLLPGQYLNNLSLTAGTEYGHSITRSIQPTGSTTTSADYGILRSVLTADYYQSFFWHCSTGAGCDASKETPRLQFDGHYTLRSPFIAEPYKEAYVNGGNEFLTTKPRHYANVNLTFPLRVGIGLNVKYQYGSLPPTFTFLNNQVTVGLQILLKHG